MKKEKIRVDIHSVEILFLYGTTKELERELGCSINGRGGCFPKTGIIYLVKDKKINRVGILGTLTHEICHLVDILAERRGFERERKHKAYIHTYLFRQASVKLGLLKLTRTEGN